MAYCVMVACGFASAAQSATLSFDNPVETANGRTIIGNHGVLVSTVSRFTAVAADNGRVVDAIIEARVKSGTDFGTPGASGGFGDAGFIPSYRPSSEDTDSDLGFLYYGNGVNDTENGVTFTFSFFDGTGGFAGTFENAITVSELEFAVYDVDGESIAKGNYADQSEYFNAYRGDGLVSYALGDTPQALVATEGQSSIEFRGPDMNFSEADPSGAVILTYEDTSRFVLDFGSVQRSGPNQNGVFSAFDGDLSLFSKDDFIETPVGPSQVPLPASFALMMAGLCTLTAARVGKRNSKKG